MTNRLPVLILWVVWGFAVAGPASAQKVDFHEYPVFTTVEPGVQCGLYALLAAGHALDRELPLDELVSGKWFSSMHGQTAADLARAARHFGLEAYPSNRMTVSTLRLADSPVVLLLDDLRNRNESNHWVTFLGFQEKKAVIYDSILGIHTVSLGELVSRWSGIGVVIHDPARWGLAIWFWQALNVAVLLLPALCFALIVSRRFSVSGLTIDIARPWQRFVAGILFVGCWMLVDALVAPVSLLSNQGLRDALRCQRSGTDTETEEKYLATWNDLAGSIVVDSRLPIAFAHGHVPGAINVPVYSTSFQIRDAMASAPTHAKIVVYCQNSGCNWASQLAAKFRCLGYRAYVLTDGFEGWKERSRSIQSSQPAGMRETTDGG